MSPPSTAIPNIGIRTSCTAGTTGTYTYFLGKPSSGLSETDRVRSGVIESGQGLNVECSVTGLGAGVYAIRATLSGTDANSRGVPVSVTLEGEVNPAGPTEDNPGTLAVDTPDTANLRNVTGLPECVIGPVYVVKEGALLADFSCPVLGDSDDTAKGCQAVGSIAIERCLTED